MDQKTSFKNWLCKTNESIGDLANSQRARVHRTISSVEQDLTALLGLYQSIPPAIGRFVDLGNLSEGELSTLRQRSALAESSAVFAAELIDQVEKIREGLQRLPFRFYPLFEKLGPVDDGEKITKEGKDGIEKL